MASFISSLKLTLEQWALLTITTAMGILLTLFSLRGSKIHKLQLELLTQKIDSTLAQSEIKIKKAKEDYAKAVSNYHRARFGQ